MKHNFETHVYVKTDASIAVRCVGPLGASICDLASGSDTTHHTTIDALTELIFNPIAEILETIEIFGWN